MNNTEKEIQLIKAVFENGASAWNRGDMDGYLHCYADDEKIQVISGGNITVGRQAVAEGFKARFTSPQAMGTLTLSTLQIELINEKNALFFGRFHLNQGDTTSTGIFTGHVKKFPAGWAIVRDHSSALEA